MMSGGSAEQETAAAAAVYQSNRLEYRAAAANDDPAAHGVRITDVDRDDVRTAAPAAATEEDQIQLGVCGVPGVRPLADGCPVSAVRPNHGSQGSGGRRQTSEGRRLSVASRHGVRKPERT